jgi:hypothetical protein
VARATEGGVGKEGIFQVCVSELGGVKPGPGQGHSHLGRQFQGLFEGGRFWQLRKKVRIKQNFVFIVLDLHPECPSFKYLS